jgi:hypothetical protein
VLASLPNGGGRTAQPSPTGCRIVDDEAP